MLFLRCIGWLSAAHFFATPLATPVCNVAQPNPQPRPAAALYPWLRQPLAASQTLAARFPAP
ncbi:hypothetical protein, partial [Hymenobacter agri]